MKIHHILKIFAALALAFFLGACSNAPSESAARQKVERMLGQIPGLVRIISFEKTNGVTGERYGQPVYRMAWKVSFECTSNCYAGSGGMGGGFFVTQGPDRPPRGDWGDEFHYAGQRIERQGFTDFVKTENGWVTR